MESDPNEKREFPLGPPTETFRLSSDLRFVGVLLLVLISLVVLHLRAGREAQERCIQNLHDIEAAKEQWAMGKRGTWDRPVARDLVGSTTDGYLKSFPKCPAKGTYTIGNMSTRPTCTTEGHKLD